MKHYSARLSKNNKIVLTQKCGEEKPSNALGSKRKLKKKEHGEKNRVKIIFMKQSMSLSEERSEKANAECHSQDSGRKGNDRRITVPEEKSGDEHRI